MGEMHDMYGDWDNGEYNPCDGDEDDELWETCVNCAIKFSSPNARLFCSDLCSEEAKLVRYVRRCNEDGRADDPDVTDAIEIRMAHVLGGGYDRRGRQVAPDVRAEVIFRGSGRCQTCGEPGTEIDHIVDSSNDPSNLQLLCHDCHVKKTQANFRLVRPEDAEYAEVDAKGTALLARFYAPMPLRDCDDPEGWQEKHKALMSEARARRRDRW